MPDNIIELIARVNVDESAQEINQTDIPSLQAKLDNLPIDCRISDESIEAIRTQLSELGNSLQIDLGGLNIDSNAINADVTRVINNIQNNLTNLPSFDMHIGATGIEQFYQRLNDLGVVDLPDEEVQRLQQQLQTMLVTITKIEPVWKQLEGEDHQALSSLSIQGLDRFGNTVSYIEKLDNVANQHGSTTIKVTQNMAQLEQQNRRLKRESDNAQKALNDFLKLEGQFEVYQKKFGDEDSLATQFRDISKLVASFDNTQPIDNQRETLIRLDNALKLIKVDIDNITKSSQTAQTVTKNAIYPSINVGQGTNTSDILSSAKTTLNSYFNANNISSEATRVKRAVEDTSGELQRFYVQVERGDKSVETLTYALNAQGNAYEYLGKTIREADNSTDFRSKDINTQWEIQTQKLNQFISNAEKAGVAATALKDDIGKLQTALAKKGDTNEMNAFLDDFDIAKAKLQALNAEARKENFADNLVRKIRTLTANMNAFAESNKRAIQSTQQMSNGKSFADEWARMSAQMAKGADLTDRELKELVTDFRVFGKEAEAAGLKGASAFGKFLNSFKLMSSYVTANMVFNFVKRQLRDMANEVVAVDTAMTELKKVTDATDAEFIAFAKSAAETGRELGASISDVIEATATFARLGESLPDAEELGKVATLYKNVGDGITEEQAAEDLISTMKAFNIEARDSITVVDKLNEVGNNYAISSGGIGEALKRSASALAAANNDLSQSIALITTANTIAQDPTTVGQGIKTMSLRIRSTKTELEEMGEDAEGAAENVSKLREQMFALTGVDIQLDENTYKSTYQILLEISKVWDRLDDLSRASVLEQLFGKRQANIGAAILENGELLERVYESAEGAAGSAMKEQAKYAESIQYSLDSLQAAYQGLSQTIMKSSMLKGLVDTGANLLDIINKIVDTVGLLPPILTAIATIRGAQGKGRLPEYAYLRTVALCA